jgi:hypothetical protein
MNGRQPCTFEPKQIIIDAFEAQDARDACSARSEVARLRANGRVDERRMECRYRASEEARETRCEDGEQANTQGRDQARAENADESSVEASPRP